ncbi:Protein CBG19973 [Caenorhabditis briggsae]|uniref:Protein CBG19973 n=1 Tax=Caenorhabditis briggsae TaxID=6238 RepID=A8XWU8_CAEBR|nr:Protein CBG19973 [Caenorhabditis briggsae]CAP37117.1 Protein CBG19973 [Caenorhabditis briggsae]
MRIWFLCFLVFSSRGWCEKLAELEFNLPPNSTTLKELEWKSRSNTSSASFTIFSYVLSIQTSSSLSVFLSGSPECPRIQMADQSGSIEIEIPDDTWQSLMDCENEDNEKQIYVHLESLDKEASGRVAISSERRSILRSEVTQKIEDTNGFIVSEHNPYTRKIKLQSLQDSVTISVTSENAENALEVYITFCPTNKGILYTTSYSPNFEISLKSPRMEMYYVDLNYLPFIHTKVFSITGFQTPTLATPTLPSTVIPRSQLSPLIIRLESQFTINGTMTVLINGAQPLDETDVADYETGRFELNGDQTKIVELKYQPTMINIQAYLDVLSGSILVYLSPCKAQNTDMLYGNLSTGPHRIEIDLEAMMDNTNCSLAEIDPSTVYMLLKPSSHIVTFNLWIPGEIATWHLAVTIGLVLLLLTACMILIVYFGRRKTGKLVINRFPK